MSDNRTKAERLADKLRIDIARDIHAIQDMYPRLQVQAFYASTSKDVSIIEAMNLHTPAARLAAWEAQYEYAEAEAAAEFAKFESGYGGADYAGDQLNWELHPLGLLASWEDVVRKALGTPTTKRATVKAAGDYLYSSITWMLDYNEAGDINFLQVDHLAEELASCRAMLENILKEGDREDTGVPCMGCGSALVKVYAGKDKDASHDRWQCKPCDEWSTDFQYRLAVRADYLRHADSLTEGDMLEQYRIKGGALRVWAQRGKVRKRGKDDSGRRLYDVDDAVKARDATVEDDVTMRDGQLEGEAS